MLNNAFKLVISVCLLSSIGYPTPPPSRLNHGQPNANGGHLASDQRPVPCDNALNACLAVVTAQDASIALLKKNNKDLADRLSSATRPPTLPTWAIIVISALAGATAARLLK